MAKDNFDLRSFLIENKMTVTSRGNKVRRHFLTEDTGCSEGSLEEKKAGRKKMMHSVGIVDVPAGIYESEDLDEAAEDINVDLDDDDFIDPEDLPMGENTQYGYWHRKVDPDETFMSPKTMRQKMFDRLGIDEESFNKFANQLLGKVHGNIPKMKRIVCQAYKITPKQADFLIDKSLTQYQSGPSGRMDLGGRMGVTSRETDTYTGNTISEDFADVANAAAREVDRYSDMDAEEEPAAADTFGSLGSTAYEAPDDYDLKGADEESIRRSYTSLKNQGMNDDRAMKVLANAYNLPEETLRSMFKDIFRNAREKAIQVDEPKEKVSTFRLPKRGSAAEKAAMSDIGKEFDDMEDPDEFVKPGETDEDEPEPEEEVSQEAVAGTVTIPVDGKEFTLTIPDNFSMDETEADLTKRLLGYNKPDRAIPYLQRAINAAQKVASSRGSGTDYLYLCTDGAYHTFPSKGSIGDEVTVTKSNGNEITTKLRTLVASIDCSGASSGMTRRQAADAAKTSAQIKTDTEGYGSMELSDNEIKKYVHSKVWDSKSIEQKLRDEYFPWSDEAKDYMDDDEIEDAKAELQNEAPVDPESEWAKSFVRR